MKKHEKAYVKRGISLFLALLLLTLSVFAEQPEQINQDQLIPTISSAEIFENYKNLVDANSSQITAEPVSHRNTSHVVASDAPEEFLKQNYNLMYQLQENPLDLIVVEEGIDENSVYRQIQYDKTTKSYLMASTDKDGEYISLLIGDEEYVITLENDSIIMRLNGENPLTLCDHYDLFATDVQESTTADYVNATIAEASSWQEINRVTYRTGAWVTILSVALCVGGFFYCAESEILGAISMVLSFELAVGEQHFRSYEVDEIEYWRSNCVLYRRKVQDWYDIGSGTGSRYYVKTKDFTFWTEPPAGSGCLEYDYPGY